MEFQEFKCAVCGKRGDDSREVKLEYSNIAVSTLLFIRKSNEIGQ